MTLTLYRVTNVGDTINTQSVIDDDTIIYNETTTVNVPNAFITTFEISTTTGIGNNQAAEEDLGDHQDLGPVENLYILRGFISQRGMIDATNVGINPFIELMKEWDEENKTNTNFKHGRFGIKIDDMKPYDIIPTGTGDTQIGLLWKGLSWTQNYEDHPLHSQFEIQLIVDKGDDL